MKNLIKMYQNIQQKKLVKKEIQYNHDLQKEQTNKQEFLLKI